MGESDAGKPAAAPVGFLAGWRTSGTASEIQAVALVRRIAGQ